MRDRPAAHFGLDTPPVAIGAQFGHLILQDLYPGMKLAGVDRGLHEEVLRGGELLAQLDAFEGQSKGIHVRHAVT